MKILILDDDQNRHDGFALRFPDHELTHCLRYAEGLDALTSKGPFDAAYLDHDLGDCVNDADYYEAGGMYCGGKTYFTGLDFAYFLRDHPSLCPRDVVIHSWNPDGAKNMEAVLRGTPGLRNLFRSPYGSWN